MAQKIYERNNDYKEVTYNKIKGISFYSLLYVRYEVILNVDNKAHYIFIAKNLQIKKKM